MTSDVESILEPAETCSSNSREEVRIASGFTAADSKGSAHSTRSPTADLETELPDTLVAGLRAIFFENSDRAVKVIVRHMKARPEGKSWLLTCQDGLNITSNVQTEPGLHKMLSSHSTPFAALLKDYVLVGSSKEQFLFVKDITVFQISKEAIVSALNSFGEPAGFVLRRTSKKRSSATVALKFQEVLLVELEVDCMNAAIDGVVSAIKGPSSYDKDGNSGCYMSFDLTDGTGTVRAVMFNEELNKFKHLIIDGEKIRVENPCVVKRDTQYKSNGNLDVSVKILEFSEVIPSAKKLKFVSE